MLLLPASITLRESRDTLRMLSQAVEREPDSGVVIDASPLAQFDTSALAVLLECQRLAQAWGKGFSVRQPPPKLAALAKLYGVDQLLFAAETGAEA
jgi:phospholipid transport system transporter-binding protein